MHVSMTLSMVEINYCNYYKNLLVEELALNPYPHKLHYGKCAVIGRITSTDKHLFLENICISSLSREFMIPDGCVKLPLLIQTYPRALPINKTCEIFGEAVLCDCEDVKIGQLPATSYDLLNKLENIKSMRGYCDENLKNEIMQMQKRYKSALLLHSLNIIDQASELIQYNLALRMYLT